MVNLKELSFHPISTIDPKGELFFMYPLFTLLFPSQEVRSRGMSYLPRALVILSMLSRSTKKLSCPSPAGRKETPSARSSLPGFSSLR